MDLNLGKALCQLPEQVFIPVDGQSWMDPALHQQLGAAVFNQFLHLGINLFMTQKVSIAVAGIAVKCAKFAF